MGEPETLLFRTSWMIFLISFFLQKKPHPINLSKQRNSAKLEAGSVQAREQGTAKPGHLNDTRSDRRRCPGAD